MKTIRIFLLLIPCLLSQGSLLAQERGPRLRITDGDGQATVVEGGTSSSSSSCNTSDFPVYVGENRVDMDFKELTEVVVHPQRPTRNNQVYISVEIFTLDGRSDMVEMVRQIRIGGRTGDGTFGLKVEDIQRVEVLR
ncbi:MAG: hypothetical protein R2751_00520 [Bacteroidales bacterium]